MIWRSRFRFNSIEHVVFFVNSDSIERKIEDNACQGLMRMSGPA